MNSENENFETLLELIMDNLYFSYSSLSTFENCKYCYKLTYIDRKEPKENNFFAEYGLLTHDTIEQYFNGSLETYELAQYFRDNYDKQIITPPPPFPSGMEGKYIIQGEEFFDTFSFEKNNYEIVFVEDSLEFEIGGIKVVGRPDLVLKNKKTKENILLDYKTSMPFKFSKYTGKETVDKAKMDGYFRQMYLYCYGIKEVYGTDINKIVLWFTRAQKEVVKEWKKEEEDHAIEWAESVIEQIKAEKEFSYDNSSSYFCNFLCSVRNFCEYKPEIK